MGSSYKIDATYLSPHVNMTSRLEAATKLYRLPILMSSAFAIELSPFAQCFLRLLDRVTVRKRVVAATSAGPAQSRVSESCRCAPATLNR